jgi:hypothetical protein
MNNKSISAGKANYLSTVSRLPKKLQKTVQDRLNAQEILKTDGDWAKAFLKGLNKLKTRIHKDERATPAYWNSDDWGSISGIRDAEEWIESQLTDYIVKNAQSRK